MKQISLLRGGHTLVDDEDFEWLNEYKWFQNPDGYAACRKVVAGKKRLIQLHRLVITATRGKLTDHINGNKLDNRKSNLRVCTPTENAQNRAAASAFGGKQCLSGYKGVTRGSSRIRPWVASIMADGKQKYLGSFETEDAAAVAYNEAAIEYHGEFARLNIVASDTERLMQSAGN